MRLIATLLLFTSASTALAQSAPAPVPSASCDAGMKVDPNVAERADIATMNGDLRNLALYEEQYAEDHGGLYFAGQASLASPVYGFRPSSFVSITVTATRGPRPNWSATASHAKSSAICVLHDGVIVPSQTFPAGDTAEVYRAALDLLYIDGDEKPKIIVVHRHVMEKTSGPCGRQCRVGQRWVHQSAMDTSTIEAFASLPFIGRPNFRQFGYTTPLVILTSKERDEIRNAGWAYDSAHPPRRSRDGQIPNLAELVRRYPGAWGMVAFTDVAFNRPHAEALLGIRHECGETCRNTEVVFFRKLRGKWTAIERVPSEVELGYSYFDGSLPYRGPIVKDSSQSELLVDLTGSPLRSDAQDGPAIYRAVLDSLYSFFGERPRKVVMSSQHARAPRVGSLQIQGLDPSTLAAYNIVSVIGDRLPRTFPLRLPTDILDVEERRRLEYEELRRDREIWEKREAAAKLNKEANLNTVSNLDTGEPYSFWHTFRTLYPGAWGYVEVSRVAYNPEHTQALVYSIHHCGRSCQNGATWFLTRTGATWSIGKMVPQDEETRWDSIRCAT